MVILDDIDASELLAELRLGDAAERFGGVDGGAVIVRVGDGSPEPEATLLRSLTSLPIVIVTVRGTSDFPEAWRDMSDVIVDEGDPSLEQVVGTITKRPLASVTLALLLRGQPRRDLEDGLVAESAAYSLLQAGPEFAAWRGGRPARANRDGDVPRVRVERRGDRLALTLTRPALRNALDTRMRDELLEGLAVAIADPTVRHVELHGEGPAFCSGGDLDEFGSRSDPASAHVIRLSRHVGRAIARLSDRTTVHLHGACAGSGIEMAAFAGRVEARPDVSISLPELSLGLIPGAGGTVSLPARIGRHRTAWLALSGHSIDAATAHEWGLVDRITSPAS